MEIADSFCCEVYQADSWQSMEESTFRVRSEETSAELSVVTTQQELDKGRSERAELRLTQVDIDTIRRLQTGLAEWLRGDRTSVRKMRTAPLEGRYEDSEDISQVRHVEIEIGVEGIQMAGIANGNRPVAGAVRIPSASAVRDGEINRCGHLERMNSLLEVFLTGVETEESDVIRSTGYLLDPEQHIHERIPTKCLDRMANADHAGVVQAAGAALATQLEEKAPPEITERARNASDLTNQMFAGDAPEFRWGFNSGEQEGIHQLYSGAFKTLRNPASHDRGDPDRNRFLDDIDKRDALDTLCLFNFLVRRLETYAERELERETG